MHGTSAALEYGVRVLKVKRIVLLGHAQCGGVQAMLDGPPEATDFVPQWIEIAQPALNARARPSMARTCARCEIEVLKLSLDNLLDFLGRGERLAARSAHISPARAATSPWSTRWSSTSTRSRVMASGSPDQSTILRFGSPRSRRRRSAAPGTRSSSPTKAHHTGVAVRTLAPHLAAGGYVVSAQNGLNELAIAEVVGAERTVGAFVNFGADYLEPGVILYGGHGAVVVGEIDGRITPRVSRSHGWHHFEPARDRDVQHLGLSVGQGRCTARCSSPPR